MYFLKKEKKVGGQLSFPHISTAHLFLFNQSGKAQKKIHWAKIVHCISGSLQVQLQHMELLKKPKNKFGISVPHPAKF